MGSIPTASTTITARSSRCGKPHLGVRSSACRARRRTSSVTTPSTKCRTNSSHSFEPGWRVGGSARPSAGTVMTCAPSPTATPNGRSSRRGDARYDDGGPAVERADASSEGVVDQVPPPSGFLSSAEDGEGASVRCHRRPSRWHPRLGAGPGAASAPEHPRSFLAICIVDDASSRRQRSRRRRGPLSRRAGNPHVIGSVESTCLTLPRPDKVRELRSNVRSHEDSVGEDLSA